MSIYSERLLSESGRVVAESYEDGKKFGVHIQTHWEGMEWPIIWALLCRCIRGEAAKLSLSSLG